MQSGKIEPQSTCDGRVVGNETDCRSVLHLHCFLFSRRVGTSYNSISHTCSIFQIFFLAQFHSLVIFSVHHLLRSDGGIPLTSPPSQAIMLSCRILALWLKSCMLTQRGLSICAAAGRLLDDREALSATPSVRLAAQWRQWWEMQAWCMPQCFISPTEDSYRESLDKRIGMIQLFIHSGSSSFRQLHNLTRLIKCCCWTICGILRLDYFHPSIHSRKVFFSFYTCIMWLWVNLTKFPFFFFF